MDFILFPFFLFEVKKLRVTTANQGLKIKWVQMEVRKVLQERCTVEMGTSHLQIQDYLFVFNGFCPLI